MPTMDASRTVVVGLDGATFDLIDPWLESGMLPAIAQVVEDGVAGRLRSVLPPVTSPNWKAYATGKNPGKLGIFWWYNVDRAGQRTYLPTDRYHDHVEFWERIAAEAPAGVVGMPLTHPPKDTASFVVSSEPDAEPTGFAHPPELEDELRERFGYQPTREHLLRSRQPAAVQEVLDLIDATFTAARSLAERHDVAFLQATTYYLNLFHHEFWDHDHTRRAWRLVDEHVDAFLADDVNVVLMSDHGMMGIETVFCVNQWLRREGYLAADTEAAETLHRLGVTADRLKGLLHWTDRRLPGVDLASIVERHAPSTVVSRLPDRRGELGASKHDAIDWDRTTALAGGLGPLYLTIDPDDPGFEARRDELAERLASLRTPDGGPVLDAVHRAEAIYDGPYVREGPDLLLEGAHGVYVYEGLGGTEDPVFKPADRSWQGVNHPVGLFAATGPDFADGGRVDLSILDLAPTLLHLHGLGIPADMDGVVRREVFAPAGPVRDRDPVVVAPDAGPVGNAPADGTDPEGPMRRRLEDLGYL